MIGVCPDKVTACGIALSFGYVAVFVCYVCCLGNHKCALCACVRVCVCVLVVSLFLARLSPPIKYDIHAVCILGLYLFLHALYHNRMSE